MRAFLYCSLQTIVVRCVYAAVRPSPHAGTAAAEGRSEVSSNERRVTRARAGHRSSLRSRGQGTEEVDAADREQQPSQYSEQGPGHNSRPLQREYEAVGQQARQVTGRDRLFASSS